MTAEPWERFSLLPTGNAPVEKKAWRGAGSQNACVPECQRNVTRGGDVWKCDAILGRRRRSGSRGHPRAIPLFLPVSPPFGASRHALRGSTRPPLTKTTRRDRSARDSVGRGGASATATSMTPVTYMLRYHRGPPNHRWTLYSVLHGHTAAEPLRRRRPEEDGAARKKIFFKNLWNGVYYLIPPLATIIKSKSCQIENSQGYNRE